MQKCGRIAHILISQELRAIYDKPRGSKKLDKLKWQFMESRKQKSENMQIQLGRYADKFNPKGELCGKNAETQLRIGKKI